MKGDFQVRFCERLKLKCFGLLDRNSNPTPAASPDRQTVKKLKNIEKEPLIFSPKAISNTFRQPLQMEGNI